MDKADFSRWQSCILSTQVGKSESVLDEPASEAVKEY